MRKMDKLLLQGAYIRIENGRMERSELRGNEDKCRGWRGAVLRREKCKQTDP